MLLVSMRSFLNLPRKVLSLFPASLLQRLAWIKILSTQRFFVFINNFVSIHSADIGAGQFSSGLGWWTGDAQTGQIIDSDTILPFYDNQLKLVYSSMFFEHINDETATNLLSEIYRCLQPGGLLRVIVPDFDMYVNQYRDNNKTFFDQIRSSNTSLKTWKTYNVPTDDEHILASLISSFHNKRLQTVLFPFQVDLDSSPPKVCSPYHLLVPHYYCGPAPEINSQMIKNKLLTSSNADFIEYILGITQESKYSSPDFNSWHKNYWPLNKIKSFVSDAGFSDCQLSSFNPLYGSREKPSHRYKAIYYNIIK